MLAGIVADRLAPAVVFGALAIASGSRAVTAVARSPSEPTLLAGLVQGLDIVHHLLTFLFCSLVAALFLVRRAPQGSRAQPLAMAVALAGTVVMSAVVVQPVTTQDPPVPSGRWRPRWT